MSIPNLDRANLDYHRECLGRLTADIQPAWGKLTPTRVCTHLSYFIGLSLGDEGELKAIMPRPLQPLMRWVFFELITTWPKGIKSPEFMAPASQAAFEDERDRCLTVLERFIKEMEADPDRKTFSPAFGYVPLSYWARLHGVHFHHHYRQFNLLP